MKTILKNIPYLIIVGLFVYILFLKQCDSPCPDIPTTDTVLVEVDTIPPKDTTIIKWKTKKELVPVEVEKIIEVPVDVDTLAILKDYFSKFYYGDTITDDSTYLVTIGDTVTQNKITNRKFTYKNLKPTIINNYNQVIKDEPKTKIYYGFGLGRSTNQFGFTGDLMLLNKKENIYSIKYDFINKDVYFTTYYKIKFKNPLKK